MEIEAKYIIPDREAFERLLALNTLGAYALQPAGKQDLVDHYFDTAVRALWQGGYAMRLREEPRSQRWRGALKGLGGAEAGSALHRREEHEVDVPPGALPATWPSSPARDLALRLSGELPLTEMFAVRQVRYKRQVWAAEGSSDSLDPAGRDEGPRTNPHAGAGDDGPRTTGGQGAAEEAGAQGRLVAELSLDEVLLAQAGRELPSFELELELVADGLPEDLDALQAALAGFGLQPQPRSKFERGLALLEEVDEEGKRETPLSETKDQGPKTNVDVEAGDDSPPQTDGGPVGEDQPGAEAPPEGEPAAEPLAAAKPARAKSPGVRADQTMAEAGRLVLRFHFERMLAHEDGARAGEDIEAVHDMRVATRRQRAALALFAGYYKPKAIRPFRRGLKALASRLGAVRDLDVLLEAARAYQAGLPPASALGLDQVLGAWAARRDAARADLLAHLDSREYRRFHKAYTRFLDTPGAGVARPAADPAAPVLVRDVLPARLWEHYGAVRAYTALLPGAAVPTLHALRIAGKRLRYALEFFAEALGPNIQEAIAAVVDLQDHLGELHDADVTLAQLHAFLQTPDPRPSPEAVLAVGGYLRVQQARLRRLQRTVGRPWKKVAGAKFRRLLGRGVAGL